jgi:hypothetical protein
MVNANIVASTYPTPRLMAEKSPLKAYNRM